MTAFFPEVYPDELFFSVCSRYHERLGYKSGHSTGRDLFESDRIKVAIDLPYRLGRFCESLPINNAYTTDRLINENTLYPIFSAFLSQERAELLRNDMIRRSTGGAAHGRAGILNRKLQNPYFKFCPSCADEDRKKWGETYWHRIHNVPRVLVCPRHHIPIESTRVNATYRSSRENFVTAEKIVPKNHETSTKGGSLDQAELLCKLSTDFVWLLNQRDLCAEPTVTCNRYRRLLFEQDLSTYAGTIRRTELHKAFLNFYPANLLCSLGCELGPNGSATWLAKIVQHSSNSHTAMQHLLLMNFLSCSVQSFFSLPRQALEPFGNGPWPCLNPTAEHFRESVITTCRVSPTYRSGRRTSPRTPIGTFTCSCGFSYCRKGPDQTDESRFQFYRVESYGQAWFSKLEYLVRVRGYSAKKTALVLKVTPYLVRVQLKKLRSLETKKVLKRLRPSWKKRITLATIKMGRAQWKAAIKANPGAGRTRLAKICGHRVYHVLLWHDRAWFEANSPRLSTYNPIVRTNWEQRDLELAEVVTRTAADMITRPGKPVRASVTAIARELRILALIHKRSELLPFTRKTLSKSAENLEEYALRRVQWCVQQYNRENVIPNYHKLQIRAAVSQKVWNSIKDQVTLIMQTSGLSAD